MTVSLDEMMAALPPESRAKIERDASALAANCRVLAGSGSVSEQPTSAQVTIGTTVRTGERCPESGVWRVADTPSATLPVAVHNLMPPYRDRAVTWELIRHVAA